MANVLQVRETYETPRLDKKGNPVVTGKATRHVPKGTPLMVSAHRWHDVGVVTGGNGHCACVAEPDDAVVLAHWPDVNLIRDGKVHGREKKPRGIMVPNSSIAGSPDLRIVQADAEAAKPEKKKPAKKAPKKAAGKKKGSKKKR